MQPFRNEGKAVVPSRCKRDDLLCDEQWKGGISCRAPSTWWEHLRRCLRSSRITPRSTECCHVSSLR